MKLGPQSTENPINPNFTKYAELLKIVLFPVNSDIFSIDRVIFSQCFGNDNRKKGLEKFIEELPK
jgi:hypothetical protein